MAQGQPLEPDSLLYKFAQNDLDLSKIPEKLRCKGCGNFVLNAFKAACCDSGLCEQCNTSFIEKKCPACNHTPLVTSASKALRGTARNYLRTQMASADAAKSAEATNSAPPEPRETPMASDIPVSTSAAGKQEGEEKKLEDAQTSQTVDEQPEQNEDVIQSIEEPKTRSRRPTIDSASGNELDDDIEINVGPDYDLSEIPDVSKRSPLADENDQWLGEQHPSEKPRKNSTIPQHQHTPQNQSFASDASHNNFSGYNQDFSGMPNEAMMNMMPNMMNGGMQNLQNMNMMNPQMMQQMAQMQTQFNQAIHSGQMMNPQMLQQMQTMMNSMNVMGMNGSNWPNMMGGGFGMGPQNFFPMMSNGASFNNGQQQYQQNFPNGDFAFNNTRNGSFDRGRGGRGRKQRGGRFANNNQFSHQNQYGNFNNMPFQTQFNQGPNQYQQNQYDHNIQGTQQANNDKVVEQHADDDDFAPGGQDEVQEALGDSYKKASEPPEEPKVEDTPAVELKHEEYQREPSPAVSETVPLVESPKPDVKEAYIPEAYREDLDFASAPPTAPSGPSAKDVSFRSRGHGRFPSRGQRGSYHGSNGFPPRSPARPISSHQNISPPMNQKPGVVGAPTGPRAMREKEAPLPVKILSRSESDVGFKIRGTASQVKEQRAREEAPRSVTPRSTYDDYNDRDRESSRRHSKHDRKHESSRHEDDHDDHDDRDRKRRKSRRNEYDDYDMDGIEHSHSNSRADSPDPSHRNGRRERDKARDKYSSSTKHKSSSRKYEDGYDDHENGEDYVEETRSKPSKKSSSRYEDREERDRRDHERSEKDKHRKRSRHDRDRDDGYEDADEEESRRRSRKHKKEHTSRKDRDRDVETPKDTDLGMRITGRSSTNRASEVAPLSLQPDKDPHTLEREARNQERMLKEQQRREAANNAKGGGLSGGRTRSYKYEDDIERQLNKPSRRR
ncbi:hypothetical protein LTS08_007584 [Lithohypha guttulata]|nr:hypothetical protein LTS08_007584 [Lithohypha guttulata]